MDHQLSLQVDHSLLAWRSSNYTNHYFSPQLPYEMGGHAFKGLYCPRISPAVYNKVKAQATAALQTIFAQVVVPTEMPCKV